MESDGRARAVSPAGHSGPQRPGRQLLPRPWRPNPTTDPRPAPGRGELSAGELTRRLTQPQLKVSNHLACLRWCGFVATRRQHRVIYYRLADQRVAAVLKLADGLLDANADHVAACCRIPDA